MLSIIWMSPGNSYFKDKEVAFLLRECIKRYGKAAIMVADVPAISTYMAMGYNMSEARNKAILKGNNLKNRTRRVIREMGIEDQSIIIVDWDNEVKDNPSYQKHFNKVMNLYEENKAFATAVNDTSKEVLLNTGKEYTEEDIRRATHYLLSEIAFLEFAPDFFGVDKIAYVYHKNWRVYEDYIAGVFDNKIKDHLDFILLEAPYETYLSFAEKQKTRLEIIKERGVMRCSYVPYFDYFKVNADGTYEGKFYDIISKIAADNDIKLEFVEQSGYGTLTQRLDLGYIDIFCSPTRPSTERKLEMFFSQSIMQSHVYAYLRTDSPYANQDLETLKQNHKLRIAVKENDIHHQLAQQYFPHARLIRVPQLSHIEDVMNFVKDNRADITFWDESLVQKYCEEHHIAEDTFVKKWFGEGPITTYDNSYALPWGEFDLKKMIDEGIEKYVEHKLILTKNQA